MTNVLEYQGYTARIEFDAEDGVFIGRVLNVADRVSFHGQNLAELPDEPEALGMNEELASWKDEPGFSNWPGVAGRVGPGELILERLAGKVGRGPMPDALARAWLAMARGVRAGSLAVSMEASWLADSGESERAESLSKTVGSLGALANQLEAWRQEQERLLRVTISAAAVLDTLQGLDLHQAGLMRLAESEHAGTPTEAVAMDVVMSNARFGGKAAARVPDMPENSLFITMPENLSIYWQRGSRFVIDNPRRKQVENYESSNEAYVIEDFGAACLVENIVFGEWA